MEKILFVYDNSIGVGYLKQAIAEAAKQHVFGGVTFNTIKLSEYPTFDDSGYDALIYNTFPDETHTHKFRRDLVSITDAKFKAFKGRKILLDSHDDGLADGFTRLPGIERIKLTPPSGQEAPGNVLPITFAVGYDAINPQLARSVPLAYCANLTGYRHNIRQQVFEALVPFKPYTKRLPYPEYISLLQKTSIAVVAPGWGKACIGHLEALACGALLFAHESVQDIKLLPYADLVDGRDYISYNLDNIYEKLATALDGNPSRTAKIRKSGAKAFLSGYDPGRTAVDLVYLLSPPAPAVEDTEGGDIAEEENS